MLAELKDYVSQFTFLTPKDIANFISISTITKPNKGEVLLEAGEVSHAMNIILKGFVRTYVVRQDGEERTTYLGSRGMPFGSTKTIMGSKDTPSNETVVALDDCIILSFDIREFKRIGNKSPGLYKMYAAGLEKGILEAVERLEFHSVMLPEQRYQYLQDNRPEIMQNVPLKYIASFIGITPVSLSRLRARIVKTK
ncbi:MAG: Crp/Fnr family transcriptional regulator [Flavobacteriales bacterium]|nr:Crp/Fnr family transcriptional regulator [Flavobacteriales bacterium]